MIKKTVLISAALLMAMCDPGPESQRCVISDPDKLIEVTYPRGGEEFRYGQDVNIQWKADTLITPMGIQVSLNGGPWKWVDDNSYPVIPEGSKAACMEFKWTIGEEHESVAYSLPDTARIKVVEYGANHEADSTMSFFIKAN